MDQKRPLAKYHASENLKNKIFLLIDIDKYSDGNERNRN